MCASSKQTHYLLDADNTVLHHLTDETLASS